MKNLLACLFSASVLALTSQAQAAYNPYTTPGTPISTCGATSLAADNGIAINSCLVLAANGAVPFPIIIPNGTHFTTQIVNPSVIPIIQQGALFFDGQGYDALVEGAWDGIAHLCPSGITSVLNVTRAQSNGALRIDWTDQFAGISLRNVYSCNFDLSSNGFYIGLDHSSNNASYYNTITLGNFISDQNSIRLWAKTLDDSVNQNTYIGGHFSTQSGGTSSDIVGVLFQDDGFSDSTINGNVFINPDVELVNSVGNVVAFKGVTNDGQTLIATNNRVYGMRFEPAGASSLCLLGGAGMTNNSFEVGYGFPTGDQSSSWLCPSTGPDFLTLQQNGVNGAGDFGQGATIWNTVPIIERKNFVLRASNGDLERGGYNIFVNLGAGNVFEQESSGFTLTTNGIQTSSGGTAIGRVLDLRKNTRDFQRLIRCQFQTAVAGGRAYAVLYNSSGTPLISTSDGGGGFFYSPGNSAWESGSDLAFPVTNLYLPVGPNVAFAFIGVGAGTAALNIRNMTCTYNSGSEYLPLADNGAISLLTTGGPFPILPDAPYSLSIPAAPGGGNSYPVGERVGNMSIVSGGTVPEDWVYTTATSWANGPLVP